MKDITLKSAYLVSKVSSLPQTNRSTSLGPVDIRSIKHQGVFLLPPPWDASL